ncbi:unnamed protein product [Lactuca saligna]|uniref:Uncharacterized protein n=1 Tax=Lactuca saligna TaxID=75948 RepID=A0AA35V5E0_LACSI|nr:unnamed protein product [Lactuca saligna]
MICSRGYPRLVRDKNVAFVRLKDTKEELVLPVEDLLKSNPGEKQNRQDHDEVEVTPMDFDASSNEDAVSGVDAYNVNVNKVKNEVMEGEIRPLLNKIRKKKSERIIKLKMAKRVGDEDAPGNSKSKALAID